MTKVQLAELDLKQTVAPIHTSPNYQRLDLLIRWGYQPLGMLRLPIRDNNPIYQPDELSNRAIGLLVREIWEDGCTINFDEINCLNEGGLPPISVIVCTRDHVLSLKRCLESLTRLDYPRFEVIVIDNCSRDPAVNPIATQYGFLSAREDYPGLDRARNLGIKVAQYELVAFIDDDAIADRGWLRGLATGFLDPEVAAVTGLVLPAEIETQAQADFEYYGGMEKGFHRSAIRKPQAMSCSFWANSWGVGTNMAFRKSIFSAIGGFDVALDVGTPTNGGGDIEFFYRLVSSGYALCYEPAALVRHYHRRDRKSLARLIYNNGRSFPAYLLTIARNHPDLGKSVFWFGVWDWFGGWLFRRLIRGLIRLDLRTLWMATIELMGAFTGPAAYWWSQKITRQVVVNK